MSEQDDNRKTLSFDEAAKLLPEGKYVHTFAQAGMGVIVGADSKREDILEKLRTHEIEVSGQIAQSMNHGLAIKDAFGYLFIETAKKV